MTLTINKIDMYFVGIDNLKHLEKIIERNSQSCEAFIGINWKNSYSLKELKNSYEIIID